MHFLRVRVRFGLIKKDARERWVGYYKVEWERKVSA